MTQEEKELVDIMIDQLRVKHDGSIEYLEDAAKAIIQKFPQITKKPLKQIWSGEIGDLHLTKIVDLLKFIADQQTKIKVYVEVVE